MASTVGLEFFCELRGCSVQSGSIVWICHTNQTEGKRVKYEVQRTTNQNIGQLGMRYKMRICFSVMPCCCKPGLPWATEIDD